MREKNIALAMRCLFGAVLLSLFAAASMPAYAKGTENREFQLQGNGTVQFAVPKAWKAASEQPDDSPYPTITFSPRSGAGFTILVTPMWAPPGKELPGAEFMQAQVAATAKEAEASAVEKNIRVKELKSKSARGYYFTATDRAPKPGEYKYLTQGMARTGKLLITFTILTNDGQSDIVDSGLKVIKAATHVEGGISSLKQIKSRYRITLPTKESFLEFPKGGLHVEMEDNARPYYFLTDKKSGLNVSFNFEPARKCRNSKECRDFLLGRLKSGGSGRSDWQSSKVGDVFVSEYTLGQVKGMDLKQRNMNAHYVVDGVWVDLHLSKVDYSEPDRALFTKFVQSISFGGKGL